MGPAVSWPRDAIAAELERGRSRCAGTWLWTWTRGESHVAAAAFSCSVHGYPGILLVRTKEAFSRFSKIGLNQSFADDVGALRGAEGAARRWGGG